MDISGNPGTQVARSTRMRELPVTSSLVMQPVAVSVSVSANGAPNASVVESDQKAQESQAPELDKYDISTLACTD